MGHYDAVIWFDDDVLITNPAADPMWGVVLERLFEKGQYNHMLTTLDDQDHMNLGVFAVKQGLRTIAFIDELFRIARKRQKLGEQWLLLRKEGQWDQGAIEVYIQIHGPALFAVALHRALQSFVRSERRTWRPGDFAAHFPPGNGGE